MARVYGFDENSYNRVRQAVRRVMGTPRSGARQRRQAPVLGGGGGGGTLTDNCECDDDGLKQGTPLEGSPTICCTSHDKWTANFGTVIGTKSLFHLGAIDPDAWSTFNSDGDLDNPVVVECYPYADDEYDFVMDVTATGATITLENREALNCDPVCIVYEKIGTFSCQGKNLFKLTKFSGVSGLEVPTCVCVAPSVDSSGSLEAGCNFCFTEPADVPLYAVITVSGASGNCESCVELNGNRLAKIQSGSVGGDCSWLACDDGEDLCGLGVDRAGVNFPDDGSAPSGTKMLVSANGNYYSGALLSSVATINAALYIDDAEDFCARMKAGEVFTLNESSADEFSAGATCSPPDDDCNESGVTVTVQFLSVPPSPGDSGHCTACGE